MQKFLNVLLPLIICTVFLSLPQIVHADHECYTSPSLAPTGVKFAKILLTNNADAQNGKTCYVPVNEGQTTLSRQELENAKVFDPEYNGKDSDGDNNFSLIPEFQQCRGLNRLPTNNYVRSLTSQDTNEIALSKEARTECVRNAPETLPVRYHLNLNSDDRFDRYIYFQGFHENTKEEKEIVEQCVLQLYQVRPNCKKEKQLENLTPNGIAEYFSNPKNFEVIPECGQAYTDCVTCLRDPGSCPGGVPNNDRKDDPRYQKPPGYQGPLPECAFSYEGCRNINDLLTLFINIGKTLFQVIGTFAFVMFVYGGFTMVLSFGNSEKFKKGQDVLVAAVVGLIIAFGAYLIIDFVLDALQVSDEFRGIGITETKEE